MNLMHAINRGAPFVLFFTCKLQNSLKFSSAVEVIAAQQLFQISSSLSLLLFEPNPKPSPDVESLPDLEPLPSICTESHLRELRELYRIPENIILKLPQVGEHLDNPQSGWQVSTPRCLSMTSNFLYTLSCKNSFLP